MYFTSDDYKRIEEYLYNRTVKDTQFPEADPMDGSEGIPIIQDNRNRILRLFDFVKQVNELRLPDFYNITNESNRRFLSLKEAVELIPAKVRKLGLAVTFLSEKGNWVIYQFKGASLNQWGSEECWIDIVEENLDEFLFFPDEEDLTKVRIKDKDYIKFKDKEYSPEEFSGIGKVYLRKNMICPEASYIDDEDHFINVLTQDMVDKENTIYIIQYDYDLEGKEITVPKGCVLWFQGGSLGNGTVVLDSTPILGAFEYSDLGTVTLKGTFNKGQVMTFVDDNRQMLKWWNGNEWLLLLDITDYNAILDIIKALSDRHDREMAACYLYFNNRCDTIQRNLDTEVSERTKEVKRLDDRINAEAAERKAADTSIINNLNQEITDRTNADTVITNNLNKEISDRASADTSITNSLNSEISRATGKEKEIADSLSNEVTRAKASEKELDDKIKAEVTRATAKETELTDAVTNISNNYATKQEVDDRIKGVIGTAPEALDTLGEIADALSKDNDAITAINGVLAGKANSSDVYTKTEINSTVSGINSDIAAEVARAKSAEQTITGNLNNVSTEVANEVTRAKAKETEIANAISAETGRATASENKLSTDIQNEVNRAGNAEQEVSNKVTSLIKRVETLESSEGGSVNVDLSGYVKSIEIEDEQYYPDSDGKVIIPLRDILLGFNIRIPVDISKYPETQWADSFSIYNLCIYDYEYANTVQPYTRIISIRDDSFHEDVTGQYRHLFYKSFKDSNGNPGNTRYVYNAWCTKVFNLDSIDFPGLTMSNPLNAKFGIIASRDKSVIETFTLDDYLDNSKDFIEIPVEFDDSIPPYTDSVGLRIFPVFNEEAFNRILDFELYYYKPFAYFPNEDLGKEFSFITTIGYEIFAGKRLADNALYNNGLVGNLIYCHLEEPYYNPAKVTFSHIPEQIVNNIYAGITFKFTIYLKDAYIVDDSVVNIYIGNIHNICKGCVDTNVYKYESGIHNLRYEINTVRGVNSNWYKFDKSILKLDYFNFEKLDDGVYECTVHTKYQSSESMWWSDVYTDGSTRIYDGLFRFGITVSDTPSGNATIRSYDDRIYHISYDKETYTATMEDANAENCGFIVES